MTGMPRIDGLTILAAVFIIAAGVIVYAGLRALLHDPGEHAHPRRDTPQDPIPPVMAGLRHRYGTLSDNGPPPFMPTPPWAPAAAPTAIPRPAPPPVIHHDEYAPPQRWHPPPATITRHHLPPSPALAALTAVTTALAAHLAARDAAFRAEAMAVFPEWRKWPGDETLTGELTVTALAAYEKALAAKDGA